MLRRGPEANFDRLDAVPEYPVRGFLLSIQS